MLCHCWSIVRHHVMYYFYGVAIAIKIVCTFSFMLFCMGSVRLYTPLGSVAMVTWWACSVQEVP